MADSLLEGNGFELSVPGREIVKPSWETGLAVSKIGADLSGNRRFDRAAATRRPTSGQLAFSPVSDTRIPIVGGASNMPLASRADQPSHQQQPNVGYRTLENGPCFH